MIKSALRVLIGFPMVFILPVLSIALLVILLPVLLVSFFLRDREQRGSHTGIRRTVRQDGITFNRVVDVSKLIGCNTRSVQYRWSIFSDVLSELSARKRKSALDFGAGSLRDTWELSRRGFEVLALDINAEQLRKSKSLYNWDENEKIPVFSSRPLDEIDPGTSFDLILAFDVLEHLSQLAQILPLIRNLSRPGGYMFVSVPNRRSLRERVGTIIHLIRVALGTEDKIPGLHHVNFKTPEGWADYFEANGFRVYMHEMTIGPLANNWHFIHAYPLGFSGLARRFPNLERCFCPEALMRRFDLIDQNLKKLTRARNWGWNLFVLTNDAQGTQ